MFLSRKQFDEACEALIAKYSVSCSNVSHSNGCRGWTWKEHSSLPGLGYMHRTVSLFRQGDSASLRESADKQDDGDEALSSLSPPQCLTCHQSVVYAPGFQVPAFYFSIHDSNGSPLGLNDLVRTSLFHYHAFVGAEATAFALCLPGLAFPVISQGDHPTLGTPCWYLHPCETPKSVNEIMMEVQRNEWSETERLVRWLETWFMIVGTVVCI